MTDKTNARSLEFASILRDRDRWPAGFTWDYAIPNCCGIGMAEKLYGDRMPNDRTYYMLSERSERVGAFLGLPEGEAHNVFIAGKYDKTPEQLADAIARLGTL